MKPTIEAEVEVLTSHSSLATSHSAPEGLHNLYHRAAQAAAAQAAHFAVLCGLELQRIRREVAQPGARSDLRTHVSGGWEEWVQQNCEFSPKTAQRYIAVAEGVKGKALAAAQAPETVALLECAPSTLDADQRERLLGAVQKVTHGETLRQLYLDFGIIKANPNDNLRKGGATHTKGRPSAKVIQAEEARVITNELLEHLRRYFHGGCHQLLEPADLRHLDEQLLDARQIIKPYLK